MDTIVALLQEMDLEVRSRIKCLGRWPSFEWGTFQLDEGISVAFGGVGNATISKSSLFWGLREIGLHGGGSPKDMGLGSVCQGAGAMATDFIVGSSSLIIFEKDIAGTPGTPLACVFRTSDQEASRIEFCLVLLLMFVINCLRKMLLIFGTQIMYC